MCEKDKEKERTVEKRMWGEKITSTIEDMTEGRERGRGMFGGKVREWQAAGFMACGWRSGRGEAG